VAGAAGPALRAIAETLVPGGDTVRLADHIAETIAALPHRRDREDLGRLIAALERPWFNLVAGGVPRPFSAMTPAQRERYLRGWAHSRLPFKRRAFQAFKRMATVIHYTARDAGPGGRPGSNASWSAIGYPGPSGPAPVAAKPIRPVAIPGDTTLSCDVVVVGSGAGGGVVAGELAAAGKDVVVLERGGYYNEGDFTHYEGESLSKLYDSGGLATTRDLGLVVLQGSCLGGGTVINYATSFGTPQNVRREWTQAHGLPHFTAAEYQRSLDAVSQRVGVTTDQSRPGTRDAILERGLRALDWHSGRLPRNVRACPQDDGCGYCGYGCRHGAKQSTLATYLRDAFERGARIVTQAEVKRVLLAQGCAVGVDAVVADPAGRGPYRLTVRAKAVVVAGGSIHSPALLMRSGVDLPALGRHLALHPATAVFGLMDEEVRPWTGTLQASYSDQFADLDGGYGFKFETAPLHPSLFALANPWESGAGHADLMCRLPRTTLVGILLRDRDGGRVTLSPSGRPLVSYRLSRYDAGHLRKGFAAAAAALEAAGAREIWSTHARYIAYRPDGTPGARDRWAAALDRAGYGPNQMLLCTFHQMASCRMGANQGDSVVNPENQVWGIPGLYVADASTFPTASGVNPMLTIMAIAHRAAGIIAARA